MTEEAAYAQGLYEKYLEVQDSSYVGEAQNISYRCAYIINSLRWDTSYSGIEQEIFEAGVRYLDAALPVNKITDSSIIARAQNLIEIQLNQNDLFQFH